jgi:uncharacterized protein (DUF983 family)
MVDLDPHDVETPFAHASAKRIVQMLGCALTLRCPNCCSRGLVASWFKMRERCPVCGLRVEREGHDYLTGSVMFNLVLAEMIFVVVLVAYLWIVWPRVNWDALEIAAPLAMAVAPFVLFPFSKLVWLAADLSLRPLRPGELLDGVPRSAHPTP